MKLHVQPEMPLAYSAPTVAKVSSCAAELHVEVHVEVHLSETVGHVKRVKVHLIETMGHVKRVKVPTKPLHHFILCRLASLTFAPVVP